MATSITDADRATALRLRVDLMEAETPEEADAMEDAIALQLAAERAKALAPLLALADELEAWPSSRCMRPHDAAERIRAAAGPDRTAGEEKP